MKSEELRETRTGSARQVRPTGYSVQEGMRAQRRRSLRKLVLVCTTAALLVAGTVVALVANGGAGKGSSTPARSVTGVVAHPDQSPPRELIAAGESVLSAYYTAKPVKLPNGDGTVSYQWSLLDPANQRYEPTDWAWLDVAPGLRRAAVLERGLPADRIGLLDLSTGKVESWIETDHGVGSLEFSPDGTRLLATAYDLDPDGLFKDAPQQVNDKVLPGPKASRSGFYVIDVADRKAEFTARPVRKNARSMVAAGRQDFGWSDDGTLVWEPSQMSPGKAFLDVRGKEMPVPEGERNPDRADAGTSPDGKLLAGRMTQDNAAIASEVFDTDTGERAGLVPGQQLLTWADDRHLIAWRCDPARCEPGSGEFRNQLILVGLDEEAVVPLSGFQQPDLDAPGRWTPLFTRR
ncbi:hypothetical protein H9Y04_16165 [Streptomyces sp. TRM66268-LWL]|uniref:WD40 repeat domain-containing protein n=1 Tax=Streptomyces polyasparticus TaxID=2767826 RepID=A0ABR7SIC1_9ACTN|nr:hypothetical protein [Streptomyces polyasparticus]MBC9714098.1 hypothetical protein [Streptomyces polyasparticus]